MKGQLHVDERQSVTKPELANGLCANTGSECVTGANTQQYPPTISLLDHAKWYASCDKEVFPCEPRGKKPIGRLCPHGLKDATCDQQLIEKWWTEKPDANIGVRTGVGLLVLDIDGEEGFRSLHALEAVHGPLPQTISVNTGSGGKHLYFRSDDAGEIRNSTGKLGKHLDVRADGGYIIAPPSVHQNGRCYEFELGCEPWSVERAPVPVWLIERLRSPSAIDLGSTQATPAIPRLSTGNRATDKSYVDAALHNAVSNVENATVGIRNNQLNIEAISLARFVVTGELDPRALVASLLLAALHAGLPKAEAERTIASGIEAGLRNHSLGVPQNG
ncbi:MAG: bifunctional DNA primase/polymerase [Geminicoccaceae bacterium]